MKWLIEITHIMIGVYYYLVVQQCIYIVHFIVGSYYFSTLECSLSKNDVIRY